MIVEAVHSEYGPIVRCDIGWKLVKLLLKCVDIVDMKDK
jgi:hypothetical protein